MGKIKRFDFEMYNYDGCDMCYAEMEEAEDGEYIEYEDHLKAITEAKKELFTREQVSKIVDYCFHKHASFYRGRDAEVAIEEAIKSIARR